MGFKPGMKLEVVDPKVPFLIRVATISAVKAHQVRVSFDGWPDELSVWLDDDSADMHPVGWCLKTGHPLEPPLTAEELSVRGPCGMGGCRGLGSVRGGAHKQHNAASTCPYSPRSPPPDRLAPNAADHLLPRSKRVPKQHKPGQTDTPTGDSKDNRSIIRGRPPKHKRVEEVAKNVVSDDESESSGGGKRWRGSEGRGSENRDTNSGQNERRTRGERAPKRETHARETQTRDARVNNGPSEPRAHLARHIAELELPPDPTIWTEDEVVSLVERVCGVGAGSAAAAARLRGRDLVMASRDELARALRLRLGPAVKVYAAVRLLRDACS